MTLDPKLDLIGIGKQASLGVIAPTIQFAHGLKSGGIKADPQQESDKITAGGAAPAGAYRSAIDAGTEITTRAWAKAVGAYLLAALGDVATVGAGAPFTSTFTMGTALDYWTLWQKKSDGTIVAQQDCKLDELKFEWAGNQPPDLSARFVGGKTTFAAGFVPTVDESDTVDYYSPVAGTFKYDVDSAVPAVANVLGGSIVIARSSEAKVRSGQIEAYDVREGDCDVSVSMTIEPDDMDLWRTLFTGTAAGAAASAVPVYGSFEHTFAFGAYSLKFAASKVGFLTSIPPADPEAKASEVDLGGVCYRVAGTPITATIVNAQATY